MPPLVPKQFFQHQDGRCTVVPVDKGRIEKDALREPVAEGGDENHAALKPIVTLALLVSETNCSTGKCVRTESRDRVIQEAQKNRAASGGGYFYQKN